MHLFKSRIAGVVVIMLVGFAAPTVASAQLTQFFCNNLGGNFGEQPNAHYVGDNITLTVDRQSNFNLIFGGTNTSLGQGTSKTVIAGAPGLTTLAASAIGTFGDCTLTTNVFVDLNAQIDSIADPLVTVSTINFNNGSSGGGGGNSYLWNFGDGQTSTQQNPSHVYNDTGTYTVQLSVTDQFGRSDTATQNITITANPNVPGEPTNTREEFIGCGGGGTVQYVFDWNPSGAQPSNVFEFQFTANNSSSNWGYVYSTSEIYKVIPNLVEDFAYKWRVRGCIASGSGCGPYAEETFRSAACGGGFVF